MYYSRFIESLLEESVRAHLGGYSIEDVVDISVYEDDSVYATLVSVVCDPRFQSTVKASKGWRDAAREELEELMDSLMYDEDDSPADDDTLKSSILQSLTGIASTPPELPPVETSSEEMFEMPPIGSSEESDKGSPLEQENEDDESQGNTWKNENKAKAEEFLNSYFFRSLKQSAVKPPKLPPVAPSIWNDESDEQRETNSQSFNEKSSKHSISKALDDFTNTDNKEDDPKDNLDDKTEDSEDVGESSGGEKIKERTDRGDGSSPSIEEQKKLELRFLRTVPPSLVRLAKLIGRSGNYDMVPSGKFLSAAKSDIAGITVGNDLSNLLPSEIAMLTSPSTEDIFLRKFAEKRLQIFASASSGENPIRHQDGPIIICVDVSGSMTGEKMRLAVALSFAICIIAKRQHRKVLIVKYSDSYEMIEIKNFRKQRLELIKFFRIYRSGGNSENKMFRWLFQQVLPKYGKFKSADVLCITDFGWEKISYRTMELIKEKKKNGMLFYGLDVQPDYSDDSIEDFATSLDEMADINDIIDFMWEWHFDKNICTEVKH